MVPRRQSRNTIYSFTQALRLILCLQGSTAEMAAGAGAANCQNGVNESQVGIGANPLRYLYRRVSPSPQQAWAVASGDGTKGVKPFNVNSLTAQAGTSKYSYAAVYNSAPGQLNEAGSYNLVNIALGSISAFSLVLGNTPVESCPSGDRTTVCFKRVDVDTLAITAFLYQPSLGSFPQPTLLAQVVAHETGHLFGLNHPERPNCCTYGPAATENNFTFPNSNNTTSSTVNVLLEQPYRFGTLNVPPESVLFPNGSALAGVRVSGPGIAASGYYPPGTLLFPFQITYPNVTKNYLLPVQTQLQKLMDWAPYLYLQAPTQWQFASSDLNGLCARIPCN